MADAAVVPTATLIAFPWASMESRCRARVREASGRGLGGRGDQNSRYSSPDPDAAFRLRSMDCSARNCSPNLSKWSS